MDITNAQEWADALDVYEKESGLGAGDIISFGYADGEVAGVVLDPNHPDAEKSFTIASEQGWVVWYNQSARWWEAR